MCPKTKEQFSVIRTRSEENILNAALDLFATKGFKATSISSIAQKAQISKGLMYNYFDSKTDLLRKIVMRAVETGTDIIEKALTKYDSPAEEIQHIVLDSVSHVKNNISYWKLLTALSFQPEVMAEIKDLIDHNSKWSFQKGEELFMKMGARQPSESSMLLGASLDGILMHYIHLKDQYPIDRMALILIDTFTTSSIHTNLKIDEK